MMIANPATSQICHIKFINQKTGMGNSEMETVGKKWTDWFQRVWCRGGAGAGFGDGGRQEERRCI
jgi:hypothetical protein